MRWVRGPWDVAGRGALDSGGALPDYGAGWSVISDFALGHYLIGDVVKVLGEVWTEDAVNWGDFDPATVVAGVGLRDSGGLGEAGPVMTPAALSGLTAGFSAVAQVSYVSPAHFQFDLLDLPDYAGWFSVELQGIDTQLRNGNDLGEGATLAAVGAGAHTLQMTLTPTKISLIVDGGSLNTVTVTSGFVNAIALAVSNSTTAALSLIKFRPAVSDGTLATLT